MNTKSSQTPACTSAHSDLYIVHPSKVARISLKKVGAYEADKKAILEAVALHNSMYPSDRLEAELSILRNTKGPDKSLVALQKLANQTCSTLIMTDNLEAEAFNLKSTVDLLLSLVSSIAGHDGTLNSHYGTPKIFYTNNQGRPGPLNDFDRAFMDVGRAAGIHLDAEQVHYGLTHTVMSRFFPVDGDNEAFQLTYFQPTPFLDSISQVTLIHLGVVNKKDKMGSFLSSTISKFCRDCYVLCGAFDFN